MNNIERCINEIGYAVSPIMGTSMLPLLKEGQDRVELVSRDRKQLKRGDVVLYKKNDGKLVLHRIIKILDENTFLTLGDHQFKNAEQVRREQIIALAKGFFINNRYIDESKLKYRIYKKIWLGNLTVRRCCLWAFNLKK